MAFPGIHFARPHVIIKHPLSDDQVFHHLFEPVAIRFGQKFNSLQFSRNGWCAVFETPGRKQWIITYLGNGESKIIPRSRHNQLYFYFEDFETALRKKPSMKAICDEYEKKALAFRDDLLPPQPYVLSARRIFHYLWRPAVDIGVSYQRNIVSFQFSTKNWCAIFELEDATKGAMVYRGKNSSRAIVGLANLEFERIRKLFDVVEELPS